MQIHAAWVYLKRMYRPGKCQVQVHAGCTRIGEKPHPQLAEDAVAALIMIFGELGLHVCIACKARRLHDEGRLAAIELGWAVGWRHRLALIL